MQAAALGNEQNTLRSLAKPTLSGGKGNKRDNEQKRKKLYGSTENSPFLGQEWRPGSRCPRTCASSRWRGRCSRGSGFSSGAATSAWQRRSMGSELKTPSAALFYEIQVKRLGSQKDI